MKRDIMKNDVIYQDDTVSFLLSGDKLIFSIHGIRHKSVTLEYECDSDLIIKFLQLFIAEYSSKCVINYSSFMLDIKGKDFHMNPSLELCYKFYDAFLALCLASEMDKRCRDGESQACLSGDIDLMKKKS